MGGQDLFTGAERARTPASDYLTAAERISPYIRRTPVLRATVNGRPVAFKLEFLQVTGSFKIRGALNALLSRRAARGPPTSRRPAAGGGHGPRGAGGTRLQRSQATPG